jgi:hypothetical protein
VARAMAAGATRTTAVMVTMMTPNGDEDNEDGRQERGGRDESWRRRRRQARADADGQGTRAGAKSRAANNGIT